MDKEVKGIRDGIITGVICLALGAALAVFCIKGYWAPFAAGLSFLLGAIAVMVYGAWNIDRKGKAGHEGKKKINIRHN